MDRMTLLAGGMAGFVSLHFLLSHPLRASLVARLGEQVYLALYSLLAFATLGAAAWGYAGAPRTLLFVPPVWAGPLAAPVMLIASILLVGALTSPNPALVGAKGRLARLDRPQGVLAITRHPLMWAIGLWAIMHILASGHLAALILAGGNGFLALAGAAAQDSRKRRELGDAWLAYEARTGFWPFAAQLTGRAAWSQVWPGWIAVLGGATLWFLLTASHGLITGVPLPAPLLPALALAAGG